jgi:hypothetical protein
VISEIRVLLLVVFLQVNVPSKSYKEKKPRVVTEMHELTTYMLVLCVFICFKVLLYNAKHKFKVSGTGVCKIQSLIFGGDVRILHPLGQDNTCQKMACIYM